MPKKDLQRSQELLAALLFWLRSHGHIRSGEIDIRLMWTKAQDARNAHDPRSFCFTVPSDDVIRCTRALSALTEPIQLGIMLHEIGHIHLNEFSGPESEAKVDAWCAGIPEAKFVYLQTTQYVRPDGKSVVAKFIESVGVSFAEMLLGNRGNNA